MEKMDNSGIELSPKEYAELSCSSMEITLFTVTPGSLAETEISVTNRSEKHVCIQDYHQRLDGCQVEIKCRKPFVNKTICVHSMLWGVREGSWYESAVMSMIVSMKPANVDAILSSPIHIKKYQESSSLSVQLSLGLKFNLTVWKSLSSSMRR